MLLAVGLFVSERVMGIRVLPCYGAHFFMAFLQLVNVVVCSISCSVEIILLALALVYCRRVSGCYLKAIGQDV